MVGNHDDHAAFADAVEVYLARTHDFRAPAAADHWAAFAEMGLLGLTLPEEYGGLAMEPSATHAIMETFGRHLVTLPYVTTLLCGHIIEFTADDVQRKALLPPLVSGQGTFALAHDEPHTQHDLADVTTTAQRRGDAWVLTGTKCVVVDGDADSYLVTARTSGDNPSTKGISLFVVDRDHPGVAASHYPTIDGARGADLRFDSTELSPDAALGPIGDVHEELSGARDLATAALCSESVGIMAAIVDDTVAYAKSRHQFGRPIGSFQAIQHRLVDLLLTLEQARSLAAHAFTTLGAGSDRLTTEKAVSAAKVKCIDAARLIGLDSVQLHGGVGMTDELRLGHYTKRLLAIEHTLGDRHHHLNRYMTSA
ncbi:acyl-CoA dehydrogenase family protein [Rhodococcus koreensis]|uniref:acyl-CoA dehydrogenase family protein n=1 Tax=Rhodococcus koreensis TaxID=99653 RepID=UPI0036DF8527